MKHNYQILKRLVLLIVTVFSISSAYAQNKTVTGKVTSSEDGAPIPGVNIIVKTTTTGTVTDVDGQYAVVVEEDDILVFSSIGYATQEVPVAGRSVIDLALAVDVQSLQEIVVVGYGEQKKATATGSISSVEGINLQRSPATNVTNNLAGRLPGLVAVTRTGEPGNDNSMLRIRGANTLGDNSPLIVIDGIANRDMSRLKSADIESITVLKDASAAIYGAQAANGVILVTTKRGSEGNLQVNVNLNQGWSAPTVLPEMADAASYAQMINEIKYYAGQPARYTPEEIQKFKDGSDPLLYPNTDWFAETVKPLSPQYFADISLSGGTERLKYFVSLGTNYQDGMYYNSATNYSQSDFRSNIDAKLSNNIRLSVDLLGRQENRNYPGITGQGQLDPFWAMNRAYPYLPARWPNGLPGPDVEYGANSTVIVTDATGYDRNKRYVMQSNMKLDITVPWVKGLVITGNAAFDKDILNRKLFQKPWYLYSWDRQSYDANNQPVLLKGKRGFPEPRLTQSMSDASRTTLYGLINYSRTIANNHDLKLLVGSERREGESMYFWAFRRNFASTVIEQMDAGGDYLKNNGGSAAADARLNYFGRFNYAYSEKYLAEFVWRYDGSFIFPEDTRFGFFPGVSLGWRISQEDFWKNNVSFVDELKIRGSWGQTGNDRIDPYQYLSSYGYNGTHVFNQNTEVNAVRELRIPNPNVTWEVANQSNIGFDAQMFNGRLSITGDYFHNLRTNILWWKNASVPASTGLSLPRQNIGEVINQGFEFLVAYQNTISDFNYTVSVNGSYAKNKIKFWDETPGVPEYQKSTGRPMNAKLYYNAIGIFRDEEAVDAYPHWPSARAGDIIFEDVNNDGVINGLDKVRNEKTDLPTFTGGMSIDLGYKNFYASILIQGAAGAVRSYRTFSGEAGNFLMDDVRGRWTEDNMDATKPRTWNRSKEYWMTDGEPNNTYWLRSSDYLRLKNLEIGYNIPNGVINKVGIDALRIYFSGSNLFTFTSMVDWDPESPDYSPTSIWVNSQVYPLMKVYNFGLALTF